MSVNLLYSKPVMVSFGEFAFKYYVYITQDIDEAEEIIKIQRYWDDKKSTMVSLVSTRSSAKKIVYLENLNELRENFCFECGWVKYQDMEYCGYFGCKHPLDKKKELLAYLLQLSPKS